MKAVFSNEQLNHVTSIFEYGCVVPPGPFDPLIARREYVYERPERALSILAALKVPFMHTASLMRAGEASPILDHHSEDVLVGAHRARPR